MAKTMSSSGTRFSFCFFFSIARFQLLFATEVAGKIFEMVAKVAVVEKEEENC